MDKEQYLKMVDEQIREARDNMILIEQSYIGARAKFDALLKSRESYIRWVMDNEVNFKTR